MNNMPNWLRVGALIEFAFCVGCVVDIAVSDQRVMVLVESPKGIWRNHPAEWIEYHVDAIKPASPERVERDLALYREYILKMLDDLDRFAAEWRAQSNERRAESERALDHISASVE